MAAPEGRKAEDDGRRAGENGEDPQLHRHAEELALPQHEEPVGIAPYRARLADAFGETAIEGERRQRGDERRHAEAGDDQSVEQPRHAADQDPEDHGERQWDAKVLPEDAEQYGDKAEDRSDRKIDAAGDDDEGHGERHESDLRHQPALIEQIVGGEEAIGLQATGSSGSAMSSSPRIVS